jgi:hypothetical protein
MNVVKDSNPIHQGEFIVALNKKELDTKKITTIKKIKSKIENHKKQY